MRVFCLLTCSSVLGHFHLKLCLTCKMTLMAWILEGLGLRECQVAFTFKMKKRQEEMAV